MHRSLFFTLAATLIATSGCATVTRGSKVDWVVETEPSDASVTTSLGDECTTPCTLELKRKTPFDVTIRKSGFRTVQARVNAFVSGKGTAGLAGNVLAGGVIGMAIDFSSGAANDLKPNPLVIALEPGAETDIVIWAPPEQPAEAATSD